MFSSLCAPNSRSSARLVDRVAGRTAARLARARRVLAADPWRRSVPEGAAVLETVALALRSLAREARLRVLHGPDLRGFLGEAEAWIAVARLAARRDLHPLFDHVARTEHLVTLLPAGRIDAGFAPRAARFARIRMRHAVADLAAFALGLRLAHGVVGRLDFSLEFREEPEQGRPADRIDLGCVQGPAGPLALARPARARARRLAPGRRRRKPGLRLVRRETIPGTPIVLAPALRSGPRRLSVGRQVRGLGRRLARALRILRLAWPDGHDEVVRRTAMVVPIREAGLVSYSLASRPGISFVNVFGKSLLDLADDLLHETAHHLLHDVQEVADLLVRGPSTEEVQAFVSPWRGTLRPLHGVLHGAYTFLFRAELFRRISKLPGDPPVAGLSRHSTAWAGRELRRERAMLGRALDDLERASRAGLLSAAGRELLKGMRRWHARLGRSA